MNSQLFNHLKNKSWAHWDLYGTKWIHSFYIIWRKINISLDFNRIYRVSFIGITSFENTCLDFIRIGKHTETHFQTSQKKSVIRMLINVWWKMRIIYQLDTMSRLKESYNIQNMKIALQNKTRITVKCDKPCSRPSKWNHFWWKTGALFRAPPPGSFWFAAINCLDLFLMSSRVSAWASPPKS